MNPLLLFYKRCKKCKYYFNCQFTMEQHQKKCKSELHCPFCDKDFKNPIYGKIPFKQNYKSEILSVSAAFKVSKKHPIVFPWNSDKMCNLVPSSNHSPATICTHTALASHLFTNVWQLTKLESWKFCISEFYLFFCGQIWSKNTTKNPATWVVF